MKKNDKIKYFITIPVILLLMLHLICPNIKIGPTTISLLVIAIVPWLGSLFKSLKLPGGTELIYNNELQKAEDESEKAGLLVQKEEVSKFDYPFQSVAEEDPQLALAGLRIEIEKHLKDIAKLYNITNVKYINIRNLIKMLSEKNIINREQNSILLDMIGILNQAAHGELQNKDFAREWVLHFGPRLLGSLDILKDKH